VPIEITVQVVGAPDSDEERESLIDSLGLNEQATDAEIVAELAAYLEAGIGENIGDGCL